MNMPGFNAETSLYKTNGHYWLATSGASMAGVSIGLAQLPFPDGPPGPFCRPRCSSCRPDPSSETGCSRCCTDRFCEIDCFPCSCPPTRRACPLQCVIKIR